MSLPVTDTRRFFRPLCAEIVGTLRSLTPADWERPTIAPGWRVRDVAAHLLDTALRNLSIRRDRAVLAAAPSSAADLAAFINGLNAAWVRVAERFSPRVLADLYEWASGQHAE